MVQKTISVTSIQISTELAEELKRRKIHPGDRYEDIIWDLLEDSMELSEETKRAIKQAEKDMAAGRVISLEKVKEKLGL